MKFAEITAAANEQTQLTNCALVLAYLYGAPGGWYCVAKGDAMHSDYAFIHDNPVNIAFHPVRVICTDKGEAEEYPDYLAEVKNAIAEEFGEAPTVINFTDDEIAHATKSVQEAWNSHKEKSLGEEDLEAWLKETCDSSTSDLTYCDWASVALQLKA